MSRFDVWLIGLDPTVGSEIRKTRPCVVVSPDDLNRRLGTVIAGSHDIAHLECPFRVTSHFAGHDGSIALDQMRAVDRYRLVRRLGRLDDSTAQEVLERLAQMFEP